MTVIKKASAGSISIHAPREGGDREIAALRLRFVLISIHAPREGGDVVHQQFCHQLVQFQSTPPARGATSASLALSVSKEFQSTPPARGATYVELADIQSQIFQSTPPARGATSFPPPSWQR